MLRDSKSAKAKTVKLIENPGFTVSGSKGLSTSVNQMNENEQLKKKKLNYKLVINSYQESKKNRGRTTRPLFAHNEDWEDIKHSLEIDDLFIFRKSKDKNSTELISLIEGLLAKISEKNNIIRFYEMEIENLSRENEDLKQTRLENEHQMDDLFSNNASPVKAFLKYQDSDFAKIPNIDSFMEKSQQD